MLGQDMFFLKKIPDVDAIFGIAAIYDKNMYKKHAGHLA